MEKGIIIVKIGTQTLSDAEGRLDASYIDSLTRQVSELCRSGFKVALVTSGAVGAGIGMLGLKQRPRQLAELQATAAIGQGRLMRLYEESFQRYGMHAAQILITQEDFADRKRFLNAKHTISTLLDEFNAVPVINENDTIATDEIRFGDNDRISALIAGLVGAHTLIILTDVDGLYSSDDKKTIPIVTHISKDIEKLTHPSRGKLGMGGMASKLQAAKIANRSGVTCIIANGRTQDVLLKITNNESLGTTFLALKSKAKARKNWLAFSPKAKGAIAVDDGARTALTTANKSLLAAGIKSVSGKFNAGDIVSVISQKGDEFAKGVSTFSSDEIEKIKGLKSEQIEKALGRKILHNEVIHKDNLAIL